MPDMLTQAQEALFDTLASEWIPDAPNCARVRLVGGTKNAVGEVEGATRERFEFAGFVGYISERLERTSAGKMPPGRRSVLTLTDCLVVGDTVETEGRAYEVARVEPIAVASGFAWDATLEEVADGPNP